MKRTSLFAIAGAVLLLGANAAYAQDEPTKIELGVDYSLVNFHPDARGSHSGNLNGGGISFVYYMPIRWIGLKADFQGYTSIHQTLTAPVGTPALPQGGSITAAGDMSTYMFGPVIKRRGRIEPYGQVLLGAVYSGLYAEAVKGLQSSGPTVNPLITTAQASAGSTTAFAMNLGFGLDIHINRAWSIRPVEVGYLLTQFDNDFTSAKNQHNFRYVAGLTFNFK